jgi:transcription antitermination factor NusG
MELNCRGVEYYLPAYEEIHQWKDRKQTVAVPLFPGYVFARFVDEPGLRRKVLMASGIVQILGSSRGPEPIPDVQIEAVRAMLDSRVPCRANPLLREGMRARVIRGALAGMEGLLTRIKNRTRLVISIPLLNQSVAAEVNAWDLELLGETTLARA